MPHASTLALPNIIYSAPIRLGVVQQAVGLTRSFTDEFDNWAARTLRGSVNNNSQELFFEFEDDCVAYLLTWTEPVPQDNTLDAAAFYAPYTPVSLS